MNRRHEPLDAEERALARRLSDEATHEPSPELDARILAAARAPSRPAPRTARPRRSRWPLALGLAASVTLAVGVAWQLREPPRPAVAPAPAAAPLADAPDDAPVSREAADAADAAKAIALAPPAGDTTPSRAAEGSAAAAGTDAAQEHRAAVAAATTRSAQRQEKALRQAELQAATDAERTHEHQAAVAAAAQRSAQRGEKAARQAASAEPAYAPPPVSAPVQDIAAPRPADVYQAPSPPAPPAPVADTGATIDALSAESAVPHETRSQSPPVPRAVFAEPAAVLSGAAAAAVEADARLPPPQWLQRIREHRDQGDAALARASLARFVRDHADVPVPDDLQPLAP